MKAYSIGRDPACDIVITDNTDVISRRHAILNVTGWGKYTIVDNSTNGTYVNGIRITPNVPVPVTRNDMISFAHISQFDWNSVPDSGKKLRMVLIAIASLLVVACVGFGIAKFAFPNHTSEPPVEVTVDSTQTKKTTPVKRMAPAKKAQDSVKKTAPVVVPAKKDTVKSEQKQDTTKKEKPKFRPIG